MSLIKGVHYRSELFYDALALVKLGTECRLRYQITVQRMGPAKSVIDVCSGPGHLRDFMPEGCSYAALDASPEFLSALKKKGVNTFSWDLHAGWPLFVPGTDVVTMVISLCQFRETSVDSLLESFKKAAKRVVIVEDVLQRPRRKGSLIQRAANYLCGTDYYVPVDSWYTRPEFENLMQRHGYQCEAVTGRYMVGLFGSCDKEESERV